MKTRKKIGTGIISLGMILAIAVIVLQYRHCVYMWNDGKNAEFLTATEYFFEVSTGVILISVLIAAVSLLRGICLIRSKDTF